MKKAKFSGYETIRKMKCEKWTVESEIIEGDSYIAWVKSGTNIPLRTRWIDPNPQENETIIETTDYYKFIDKAPTAAIFEPKGACSLVNCSDAVLNQGTQVRPTRAVEQFLK